MPESGSKSGGLRKVIGPLKSRLQTAITQGQEILQMPVSGASTEDLEHVVHEIQMIKKKVNSRIDALKTRDQE